MDVWEVPVSSCPDLDRGPLMDVGPEQVAHLSFVTSLEVTHAMPPRRSRSPVADDYALPSAESFPLQLARPTSPDRGLIDLRPGNAARTSCLGGKNPLRRPVTRPFEDLKANAAERDVGAQPAVVLQLSFPGLAE